MENCCVHLAVNNIWHVQKSSVFFFLPDFHFSFLSSVEFFSSTTLLPPRSRGQLAACQMLHWRLRRSTPRDRPGRTAAALSCSLMTINDYYLLLSAGIIPEPPAAGVQLNASLHLCITTAVLNFIYSVCFILKEKSPIGYSSE